MAVDEITRGDVARPAGRRWRFAAVLVTVLALAASGAFAWYLLSGPHRLTFQDQSQTYQHTVQRVEFDLAAGDITVSPGSADTVSVQRRLQYHSDKPTVTEQWSGDTLKVTSKCPAGEDNCAVHYTGAVPPAVAVQAHTGGGHVTIRDLTGDIHVETGGGGVRIENATGTVWVRSGGGEIVGIGLRAPTTDAETRGGLVDLTYAGVPKSVRAVTAGGDVRVGVPQSPGSGPDGYQVQADTVAGTRQVSVKEDSAGQHVVTAHSGGGDVMVYYV